jgi:hypothetical protein
MKNPRNKIINLVLVLAVLFFGKCTLLEQDIDGELSTIIGVNESKDDTNIQYSSSSVISADSDEDIKDNLDKIKDWSVSELSYSIMNFNGDPATTFSGTMGFSRRNGSSATITASVSNLKFSDVSDNGKKYKVGLSESDLNTIAGWFNDDQAVKIYLDGVLSDGPVSLDVKVYAKVKIKVKIL